MTVTAIRENTENRNATEHGGLGREDRHSRMGIASSVLGTLMGATAFFTYLGIFLMFVAAPRLDVDAPIVVLAGLIVLASILASLVGLGLGIAGLVQRRRKRLFAVLGTISSVLAIVVAITPMVLGSL